MPRFKRETSETGIYHVMTRGNGKNNIFIDKEDKEKYLSILQEKKDGSNYILYAYCIMTNHSHLIIRELNKSLPDIMKRINTSYALYFNEKYDRVGHVFQDRYLSEPIEDDNYLLTAVRYVHNNPINANITKGLQEYPWSSYRDYIRCIDNNLVDIKFILSLFSDDINKSIKIFEDFSIKDNNDKFIDIDDIEKELKIKKYEDAKIYIRDYLRDNRLELEDLKKIEFKDKRNELILYLRQNSGLSIRQIAQMLNIGRNMVANAK